MGMKNVENVLCDQIVHNAKMKYSFSPNTLCIVSFSLLHVSIWACKQNFFILISKKKEKVTGI